MSLALFPNMGSSASVAVTRATVVPVEAGSELTRVAAPFEGGSKAISQQMGEGQR